MPIEHKGSMPAPRILHKAIALLLFWSISNSSVVFVESFHIPCSLSLSSRAHLGHHRRMATPVSSTEDHPYLATTTDAFQVYDADREEAEIARKNTLEHRRQKALKTHGASNRDDPEWQFFDTARVHVAGEIGRASCRERV